jgi:hypothetical protein
LTKYKTHWANTINFKNDQNGKYCDNPVDDFTNYRAAITHTCSNEKQTCSQKRGRCRLQMLNVQLLSNYCAAWLEQFKMNLKFLAVAILETRINPHSGPYDMTENDKNEEGL